MRTGTPNKNVHAAAQPSASGTNRVADVAVCAWFLLTAIAFWGPYAGLTLPFGLLTALYAAFLLAVIADAALRILRSSESSSREKKAGG